MKDILRRSDRNDSRGEGGGRRRRGVKTKSCVWGGAGCYDGEPLIMSVILTRHLVMNWSFSLPRSGLDQGIMSTECLDNDKPGSWLCITNNY